MGSFQEDFCHVQLVFEFNVIFKECLDFTVLAVPTG
jgi:hypothetical protein